MKIIALCQYKNPSGLLKCLKRVSQVFDAGGIIQKINAAYEILQHKWPKYPILMKVF